MNWGLDWQMPYVCFNRLAMHEESSSRRKVDDDVQEGAVPAYLLDRENTARAKVCNIRTLF